MYAWLAVKHDLAVSFLNSRNLFARPIEGGFGCTVETANRLI
jgi:hypothetical protein